MITSRGGDKMKRAPYLPIAIALIFTLTLARPKGSSADEKAIKDIAVRWQDAWNRHDVKALSTLVAEDVDFVNVAGIWLKNRKEFEEAHTRVHQMQMKDSVLTNRETQIRFVRPDIAVVHVEWGMKGDKDPDGTPRQSRQGILTWVVEKQNGKWLIIAAHNTNLSVRAQQANGP